MTTKPLNPKKSLNKAYLKVKPLRHEIEVFKAELTTLLDRMNDVESEEFHKNLVSDFLKKTYYDPGHFINTKGRNDLVIHNGNTAKTSVGVILETKKPTNRAEMISRTNLNAKAFQELVLYYLRERIGFNNPEVKHLVVTNINEWYIFDAAVFERLFAQDKKLVQQFKDFEGGRLAGTTTDFFYSQIAQPFIAGITSEVEFAYFDIRDYEKPLRNDDLKDDNKLIALFKLLSPEHLLKLPFANDSNNLDKRFYTELLHIIGLTEAKEGGKKVIQRNPKGKRNPASILEDAIIQLETRDKISRLDKPSQYGDTHEERLFNVALQLSITWINRILFLKLLEAQLLSYHKGDANYNFLNIEKIPDFDYLDSLFFQVLAKEYDQRIPEVQQNFALVPYLNSSLFEPTEMEHNTIFISNLKDDKMLPILPQTVLKDENGRRITGELSTLEYLFAFLNAYDFSSEGSEAIQEDNKSLINASVLGLIFEKINGYKDGSFFTPGFITMYMCRETIRKAVVQKFNDEKGWKCETLDDVYDKIEDRDEANALVNSIKICDPAVGSGHFLVSALNEMIAIKSDLRILQDREGRRLREYHVEVVNDELIVTNEDGGLFEYRPHSKESRRVQEALFHEKQTIIENCLFGVDINPNSVKICRLRLWIELLKNAYYRNPEAAQPALETLPNIDINIKTGNSLISRFALDADLKKALRDSKWTIDGYRNAVATYRNAENKAQKREMEQLIADIKNDFRSEINANDPKVKRLYNLKGELYNLTQQQSLFEMSAKEKAAWNKKVEKLTADSKKLEAEIEEIKNNKIYENAFEWRFEFPEVLNADGDFVGFDVVIGNPPYGASLDFKDIYKHLYTETSYGQIDTYKYFIQRGLQILKRNSWFAYITSDSYLEKEYFSDVRLLIADNASFISNTKLGDNIFEEVNLPTAILELKKGKRPVFAYKDLSHISREKLEHALYSSKFSNEIPDYKKGFSTNKNIIDTEDTLPLIELYDQVMGVKVYQVGKGQPKQSQHEREHDIFIFNEKTEEFSLPFISQGIKRYYYENKNEFIKYGPWLAEPRNIKYFENPKIVIREIINPRIFACFIPTPAVIKNIAAVIIQKDIEFSLGFLLGLMNSKLLTYYVNEETPKAANKSYPSFNSRLLKNIPVKTNRKDLRDRISELALQIHSDTQNQKDISPYLDSEIDRLVYELYGLTEEEIAVVEGSVGS